MNKVYVDVDKMTCCNILQNRSIIFCLLGWIFIRIKIDFYRMLHFCQKFCFENVYMVIKAGYHHEQDTTIVIVSLLFLFNHVLLINHNLVFCIRKIFSVKRKIPQHPLLFLTEFKLKVYLVTNTLASTLIPN